MLYFLLLLMRECNLKTVIVCFLSFEASSYTGNVGLYKGEFSVVLQSVNTTE